jgi:DnaJ-class molecular chaperone
MDKIGKLVFCKTCNGKGWVTYQKEVPCGLCIGHELAFKRCEVCRGKGVHEAFAAEMAAEG